MRAALAILLVGCTATSSPRAVVSQPDREDRSLDQNFCVVREQWPRHTILDPVVVGEGRIRMLVDALPERLSAAHPELLNETYMLVEVTPAGTSFVRPWRCPEEGSGPLAITAEAALCTSGSGVSVVALDASGAPRPGPHAVHELAELGDLVQRSAILAPTTPPFVAYRIDQGELSPSAYRAQALASGARPFELEAADTKIAALFEREGTVHVVLGHDASHDVPPRRYEVLALTEAGLRPAPELDWTASAPHDCGAPDVLPTRSRDGGLALTLPLAFHWDEGLTITRDLRRVEVAGAHAIPGPRVWAGIDVCRGTEQVARDGSPLAALVSSALTLDTHDMQAPRTVVIDDHVEDDRSWVACDATGCVAVYRRFETNVSDELRVARIPADAHGFVRTCPR